MVADVKIHGSKMQNLGLIFYYLSIKTFAPYFLYPEVLFVTEATQFCVHGGLQQIEGSLAKNPEVLSFTISM